MPGRADPGSEPEAQPASVARHRWTARKALVVAAGFGLVIWFAAVTWTLVGAWRSAESGRNGLEAVRRGATPASLLADGTRSDLIGARADLAEARAGLRSPVVAPLRLVPLVGRQVRAADAVVGSADGATALALDGIEELRAMSERDLGRGPARVGALEDLADVIVRVRGDLVRLDPGSSDGLIGALAEGVEQIRADQAEALASLERAERAARTVAHLLEGPTTYLLLGANNAEMRAGSGMFLSAADLHLDGGEMELGEVLPTAEIVLPEGAVVVGNGLEANWPWIDVGRDLRNLGLTADFPQSAQLAAANWSQLNGGRRVDGVIAVDVEGLRGLLRVVGPVEVDGVVYEVDTIRGELLRDQYTRFGTGEQAREERRDQLGEVARAVFDRIESGRWELDELATALVEAVERRHLMIWGGAEGDEEAWASLGADGHLRDDSLAVSLINRSAAKLDSYLDTRADLVSTATDDGRLAITIRYRMHNGAPVDGVAYVVGPNVEGLAKGEYRGIVVVNLPAGTTDVEVDGGRLILSGGDGPTVVAAAEVSVGRDDEVELVVHAVLPSGLGEVALEPSARVPWTRWTADGRSFETERRRGLSLGPGAGSAGAATD